MVSLLIAALSAATPVGRHAHESLRAVCLLNAADPKNPWVLAHGITALGPNFLAADGRKATDVIVHDYLRQADAGTGPRHHFDRFATDGTPIEPHPNLLAKTFVLSGLPLSTRFAAPFGKLALGDLLRGVERDFHAPRTEEDWRRAAWTLNLLGHTRDPGALIRNGAGEAIDFDEVMDGALAYLESAQADLAAGMDRGLPQIDKRKQGIYAHPCGGLHLFQAVAGWARHPSVRKRWGARLRRQVDVLFYRLGSESRQYNDALEHAAGHRLDVLAQMVKFGGHFLETIGALRAAIGFRPTEAERHDIARAKVMLDFAVRSLEEDKVFESLGKLKVSKPQLYLDLIGDACHAAHGFDTAP